MNNSIEGFAAYVVRKQKGAIVGHVEKLTPSDWQDETSPTVVIEVAYSSLNYKDALACQGNKGVAPKLPHVPGIDCAGKILSSESDDFQIGDSVLVTGYDLGGSHWGGYAARVRVPAGWVVPMPPGLDPREAMLFGTAGFTAAQCVQAVTERVSPDGGPVLVTGATGGVGIFAVMILAKLGYQVVAMTGKPEHAELLRSLGATEVVGREVLSDTSNRPLLTAQWAGAVDTVGGAPLATLLRSIGYRGVVAACGLVAGAELATTVYPFILRGVTLAGIDSAKCPREPRLEIWQKLAGPWRVQLPEALIHTVTFDGLPERVGEILAGSVAGRTLVKPE